MNATQIMTYITENWYLILSCIFVIIYIAQRIWEFIGYPTSKKKEEIRNRLLEIVRKCEAELGSGTGQFKLSKAYDMFCEQYPYVKKWFTYEQFDAMVQEALKKMEESFTNEKVKVNALAL